MLSRCFLDFSVGEGAFVIGPSQISSFFFSSHKRHDIIDMFNDTSQYLDDIFTIDNPEF